MTDPTPLAGGAPEGDTQHPTPALSETVIAELTEIVGPDQVHGEPAEKLAYSYDGTFQQHVPDLALTPGSEDEVARIMQVAARERLPVVPRGAGSSLTGGT